MDIFNLVRRLQAIALTIALIGCGDLFETNHSPIIDPIPPQFVYVGETLELAISARDEDGDTLKYTITPRPIDSRFEVREGVTYFIWSPLPPDAGPNGTQIHKLTLRVVDDSDAEATRTLNITVEFPVGPPVFVGGAGYVLNLSEDDDISFVISVKDDDSESVVLRMLSELEGAKLVKLDSKSASFYWKPSDAQKLKGNYWQLEVGAKDEKHDEVQRKYSILLMNSDAAKSCKGTPPIIVHSALSEITDSSLVFKVNASDFESPVREVTVHYATSNPLDPASYKGNQVTLVPCTYGSDPGCPEDTADRYFIAALASPGATASIPLNLYYYVTAVDNDDIKGTTCDLTSRFPKAGYLTAVMYPVGWASGCKDDDSEPNDNASTAKPISAGALYGLRACNKDGVNEDWYQLDISSGSLLNVELLHEPDHGVLTVSVHDSTGTQLAPALGALPVDHVVVSPGTTPVLIRVANPVGTIGTNQSYDLVLNTSQGGCDNDAYEPNDTPQTARLLQTGQYQPVICPGDRDYISIQATSSDSIVAELDFQHSFGDLDMALFDMSGQRVAASQTNNSQERIVYHVSESSTYTLEIKGYHGAINSANLSLSVVPTNTLCFEDSFSPNHVIAQAQLLPEQQYGPLLICANKQDWFRVDVNPMETVQIYGYPLAFNGGVLGLEVYHDEQGILPMQDQTLPDESALFPPDGVFHTALKGAAGSVWWRFNTPGAVTFPYLMGFSVYDPPGVCQDDRFAPNQTPKGALKVKNEEGFVTRLKICGPGEDWYRIEGKAFKEIFVYVFGFGSEQPPLQATLLRFADETLGNDTTASSPPVLVTVDHGKQTTNGVELRFLPDKNQDFYIHVEGPGNITYHYDLVFGVE